jgi:hypothetical protein
MYLVLHFVLLWFGISKNWKFPSNGFRILSYKFSKMPHPSSKRCPISFQRLRVIEQLWVSQTFSTYRASSYFCEAFVTLGGKPPRRASHRPLSSQLVVSRWNFVLSFVKLASLSSTFVVLWRRGGSWKRLQAFVASSKWGRRQALVAPLSLGGKSRVLPLVVVTWAHLFF